MKGKPFWLFAGISALAVGHPALAQDIAGPAQDAPQDNNGATDEQIVVTGSRLVSNGNNQPTPVTVVTAQTLLTTSPSNVPDGLKKLPAFALSRGTAIQADSTDNFTGNYLNLRGIGIQRNLILLDGHRVAPTSYTGAVDTNILPQMLLQRVDVVTGGASAVYGSDAVSGVVNFVLDKKYEGLKLQAQSGISSRGDAFSWRAGGAFGTTFADDRAHFMVSYEHFQQDGFDKEARASGAAGYALAGSGTSTDPFRLVSDARNASIGFLGSILTGALAGQQFVSPGVSGPFVHGVSQGGTLESGGDGFYGKGTAATADLRTDQAYARLDYDLTDDIRIYAQGIYAKAHTYNTFYPNLFLPVVVGSDNAFISPATQAALAGPFLFGRVWDDPEHQLGIRSDSETWIASGGVDGKVGDFAWNVFYQHGVSTTRNSFVNNLINGRQFAALDAVDQGLFSGGTANGNIVCRVTLTNPTAYPGCVPLNAFGGSPTDQDAALDYIYGTTYNEPKFTLDNVSASISGTAFDNWAGPVRVALSGEYRWLQLDVSTNAPSTGFADCTGIRFNCVQGATPYYNNAQTTPISVSENVGEIAGELEFPLFKDNFAGSASLNGAVRYTNYSTSGGVTTWKLGGDWEPVDDLRIRATRSRDIRAPSLYNRYQPATLATSGYQDLHTGFNGIVPTENAGNPDLVPEVANTLTVGAVLRPSAIAGLSISIDYYRIKMNNAISSIDGRLSSVQKLCEDAGGTGPFCSLYERPLSFSDRTLANTPTLVRTTQLNASSLKTWGIDGEINYNFAVGAEGRISLRGLVGYQPQLTTLLLPGTTPNYGAGAAAIQGTGGVPKWRLTGFVSYSNPDWSLDIQERWRSSLKWDPDRTLVYAEPDIPSIAYTDVTLTVNMGRDSGKQFFLSVQNLFDADPPVYVTSAFSGTPNFSFPSITGDDVIGRYVTAGIRLSF
jgi:outer membrane receptor protein involved in Fe transport